MSLRNHAIEIWKAGVRAVDSEVLVRNCVQIRNDVLNVAGTHVPLSAVHRIEVVGAGKAGAGMARGLQTALGKTQSPLTISGWVNVPADCVAEVPGIHLHDARPAGINEPTEAGMSGTQEILRRVKTLRDDDVCIVLISGGGSALLPCPVQGISLADKRQVTRFLASRGAPIHELNCVRSQLSQVKGGGLARACTAGRMIVLIISDVIGNPLEIIASGPTMPTQSSPADALAILKRFGAAPPEVPESVFRYLAQAAPASDSGSLIVSHHVIGSNQVALDAAAAEARRQGFRVVQWGSENSGEAHAFGSRLFAELQSVRAESGNRTSVCLLAGGETTVTMAKTSEPRMGGRNQEVVLGAVARNPDPADWNGIVLLSGGTDGEDGPTPAAGAFADADLVKQMQVNRTDPNRFLSVNNSYAFFEPLNGLLITGPTHTNVMDLQVGIVEAH